jgi:uncharacterized C2H2 Zn-finger protein
VGEYADMILDGFVDQYTGEVIDGRSPGYPRSKRRKKVKASTGGFRCNRCGKWFKTQEGVDDHIRDVHSGRVRVNGQLAKLDKSADKKVEDQK